MRTECTLSNEELIEKCNDWVTKLARSGGRDWKLHVPVSFNSDPDMLFVELANRFKALSTSKEQVLEHSPLYRWVKASERLPKNDWYGVVKWTDSADWANFAGNFYEGNIYSHGKQYHNQPFEWLEKIPSEQLYSRT